MTESSHDSDVAFIRALAELLRMNDLSEIQVKRDYGEDSALNVRLSRTRLAPAAERGAPWTDFPLQEPPSPGAERTRPEPAAPDLENHPGLVTSPMVGTVYLQAEPGVAPFIAVGSTVREGDTLLIVEAMKTMNHIPAPRAGTVTEIIVENGTPVEYGAPLLVLE